MKMDDIVKLCEAKSIRIFRDNNELVIKAPRGAMNTELASLIREHKQALLEHLPSEQAPKNLDAIDSSFTFTITPDMLTLVKLSQDEINGIVARIPGGASNIKDIYPLAPLQEGILFHHLMQQEGDPYLLPNVIGFKTQAHLTGFIAAMKRVMNRHDILRTAIIWQGLDEPVQVVCREAQLPIETLHFDDSEKSIQTQLEAHIDPRYFRFDVSQAPLVRCFIAQDFANNRWLLGIAIHHLAVDHTTLELMIAETIAIESGREAELPPPVPFRNFVAQARLGVSKAEHDAFFTEMLGDIDESTAPFDIQDVQSDSSVLHEAHIELDATLAQAIRRHSKKLGVSAASLFHLAWGMVLARITGKHDIVFGTVLFGRTQGGAQADRGMGVFINTLPLRISIGEDSPLDCLKQTHLLLIKLLKHEHASLAQAQRASAVGGSAPLFTSLLNYRYQSLQPNQASEGHAQEGIPELLGFEPLSGYERTNYPLTLSVDDLGTGFIITLQARQPIAAQRVAAYTHTALNGLVNALDTAPDDPINQIDILPAEEQEELLYRWNETETALPKARNICELFEQQAAETPDAVALMFEGHELTYDELNQRANQLAHYLHEKGVGTEARVAICVERGFDMVIALLGTLKAGGAYVPLDPAYPADRLAHMLSDSTPVVCVVHQPTAQLVLSIGGAQLVDLDDEKAWLEAQPIHNPTYDSEADNLAYIIYTSGSTGKPKGVMVTQRNVMNFMMTMRDHPGMHSGDILLNVTSLSFDIAGLEIFLPLICGARTILTSRANAMEPAYLARVMETHQVTVMQATPSTWRMLLEYGWPTLVNPLKILCGGEALPTDLAQDLLRHSPAIWNMYGPTETTIWSAVHCVTAASDIALGRPIANTKLYILDEKMRPVPLGASGELYIGGTGVARGYFNRPDLTVDRFLQDPFARQSEARMYKTGDLCRFQANGNLEYLGRNDFQVKIRGFRIELGEIENQLNALSYIKESIVLAVENNTGEKSLLAYVVLRENHAMDASAIRAALALELPHYMLPNAFIQLESMPLTPNGKLDRKTLMESKQYLDQTASGSITASATRAPETATEQKLHQQWMHVLNIADNSAIGCDDDFFELGGTSLSIIRMTSFITKEFEIDISVTDLFNYRTIQQLASYLDNQQNNSYRSSLVRFGSGNTPIIFCVPGVNGHALSFKDLANALPDCTLQCFEPIDIRGQQLAPLDSLDSLCDSYLKDLKHAQPQGPYRLIGHSFGGMVALKLASLLEAQGDIVDAVGLLDTVANLAPEALPQLLVHRNSQPFDASYIHFIFANFENYLQCDLEVDPKIIGEMTVEERLTHLAKKLAQHQIIHTPDTKFIRDYLTNRKRHEDTMTDYFLQQQFPIFEGRVQLFKAENAVAVTETNSSEDYGWQTFLKQKIDVVQVQGSHETLLMAPHSKTLATVIRQLFDGVSFLDR